jgi:putative oxidoreductase
MNMRTRRGVSDNAKLLLAKLVLAKLVLEGAHQSASRPEEITMADITAPRHYVPAFSGIYAVFDPIALPLLRLTTGVVLMPHGCQKLFGWFGGAGFEKFTGFFDKAGWHPAAFWVALVALTELVGGFMLAVGFLTRFASAAIAIFMLNAIWSTSAKGFFWTQGGFEYSLLILVVALVFLTKGGGRYSVDHALGREL